MMDFELQEIWSGLRAYAQYYRSMPLEGGGASIRFTRTLNGNPSEPTWLCGPPNAFSVEDDRAFRFINKDHAEAFRFRYMPGFEWAEIVEWRLS